MKRKILSIKLLSTGYGTHSYDTKYQGEWEDWALINCIDGKVYEPTEEEYEKYNKDCRMNWGGNVERIYTNEGITRAKVDVYYD